MATALASCLAPVGLAGCTLHPDQDHSGDNAPRALPLRRPARVAWVFSSGGPRGFVHVGVLKALQRLGLQPDLIVGASIGSLVGVMFAAGRSAADIEALALDFNPLSVARLALGAEERFSGKPLADLVRGATSPSGVHRGPAEDEPRLLQDLPLPAVCVAQRLPAGAAGDGAGYMGEATGDTVGFSQGDAGLAVQASCAIPGLFTPVRIRGQLYADADLRMPLPVRLARSLGAQRVLAVDASAHESRAPASAQRWRESDLRKRALTQPDADAADLLLHPYFGYYVSLSRDFRESAIEAGYRETLAMADKLRRLHPG